MSKTPRPSSGKRPDHQATKPAKAPRPAAGNPKLTGQTRKLLGKHYAAKYGKRKGG